MIYEDLLMTVSESITNTDLGPSSVLSDTGHGGTLCTGRSDSTRTLLPRPFNKYLLRACRAIRLFSERISDQMRFLPSGRVGLGRANKHEHLLGRRQRALLELKHTRVRWECRQEGGHLTLV